MNFSENDVWREKTKLPNFKLSKLARAKVLLKLEFDTEDQVLSSFLKPSLSGIPGEVRVPHRHQADILC